MEPYKQRQITMIKVYKKSNGNLDWYFPSRDVLPAFSTHQERERANQVDYSGYTTLCRLWKDIYKLKQIRNET